jgi:predicted ATPase
MKYYLDNFRGFQDTYIELKDVNFLVGENSSGKTSLINALTILNDFGFWMRGIIPFDEIEFNTFGDFKSANSNTDCFSLGLIENTETVRLFSFKNDDGMPMLFREIIYTGDGELFIIEQDDIFINYHYSDAVHLKNTEKPMSELFDYWKSLPKSEVKVLQNEFKRYTGVEMSLAFAKDILEGSKGNDALFRKIRPSKVLRLRNNTTLAPIRARPLPMYMSGKKPFSAEGEHIPFLLKEMLSQPDKMPEYFQMLTDYGKESGLFDALEIKQYSNEKTAPFELLVKRFDNNYKITSVGYGVSQVLPIITEMIKTSNGLFSVQQPEVHLHPRAQASFGAFLYSVAAQRHRDSEFVIETHSDYIIDRFRYQIKESKNKVPAQVLFFKNDGRYNIITSIKIQDDGKYDTESDAFEDFRSFFIDESFRVMEI